MTVNTLPNNIDWDGDVWPAFQALLHSGSLDGLDMAQVTFSFSSKNGKMKISAVAAKTDSGVYNNYFYKDVYKDEETTNT